MINIKYFESDLLKIDKKSQKNIDIYYIGYKTIKDHLNILSVNTLYLAFNKSDRYIEEKHANKYLILSSNEKIEEVLSKCTELWNKIKNLIEKNK